MRINTSESIKKNSLAEVSEAKLNASIEKMSEAVKSEMRVPVYLYASPDVEAKGPKFVGLNGYKLYIPYNKQVSVPYSVASLLRDQRVIP